MAEHDEHLADECPSYAHWHQGMKTGRLWDICDVRVALILLILPINAFSWQWLKIKLVLIVVSFFVMTALEARRITIEIALKQLVAWTRGPLVPNVATRSHTHIDFVPRPTFGQAFGNKQAPRTRRPARKAKGL